MKRHTRNLALAALALGLAAVSGSATAQPDVACSFEGQVGHVPNGPFGYEVWYCFGGEWRYSHTCNRDGTCNPIEP